MTQYVWRISTRPGSTACAHLYPDYVSLNSGPSLCLRARIGPTRPVSTGDPWCQNCLQKLRSLENKETAP